MAYCDADDCVMAKVHTSDHSEVGDGAALFRLVLSSMANGRPPMHSKRVHLFVLTQLNTMQRHNYTGHRHHIGPSTGNRTK